MKKYIFKIILLVFFLINVYCNLCYAADGGFIGPAKSWLENAESRAELDKVDNSTASTLTGLLLTVGVAVDVIVGAILGIRYMLASTSEKADLKKITIWYIVGSVIILGGIGLWKPIVTSFDKVV